ncbi:Crp/Fnr family transcriptional regulator [Methylobacterium sp. 37f]|uniref:Crp/Fnr family transcriptional regulator n=1 Tax=Methylobacterium sp. 37f TaxID=2817058 RepID=UPI001FFDA953|nr:Crp/Fnr family transcriptional regulator [Methylobacterium sp. 37f]MCK2056849.1 Crp/Fnr family transcriptional regulator [Methylobacterium sp. 37f]
MLNPFIQKLGRRFILSGPEEKALTDASARVRDVPSRTALISEGDVPDHVQLIQRGFACRYKVLPSGGQSIVAFLLPGDFCDLNVSILGEMDHCIGTISSCDVVRIPRSVMNDLTGKHPGLNRALQWAGLVDEAILREWLVCMGRRSADEQVAHLFCEFLIRLQIVGLATENSYAFPLTQVDLGDATGLSNVHINRVLQELRRLGLVVVKEKRVTLPDVAAIQAHAGFNPNYLHLHPKAPPYPAM